jgi:hypothetical protein
MVTPRRCKPTGDDVTTIFLLIPGLVFALAALGLVWIRVAAAEYRHNWCVPQDRSRRTQSKR